jgi:hypothetical protein
MQLVDRVHGVKLLLGSLNDPYPTPQGALRPDSGPSPSRYVPCETCRSTGRIRARGGFSVCLLCDGTGSKRRERDDAPWDAYMRLPLDEAAEIPREPEPARLPPPEDGGYAWERAQAAHERNGSYRELRRHLDWLRQAHPRWHQLVKAVLVEHDGRELGPRAALELELGVVAVALRMRSVRVPRWLRQPAEPPTQTVAALAARGMKAGEIARAMGMTKKAVRRQLKRLDSRHAVVPERAT